jgi:hypothetical protein
MCGWFISGWLRITIQIESCDSSTFSRRSLCRLRSITSKCSRIARTSTHREVMKAIMWIGHKTSPSCLSRRCDRTTLPSIMFIWGGIIRKGWLQSGTEWTLRNNWVSQYYTPRSLWMNWHTYHIHTRMSERLALKNIYADISFSQEYSHLHWLTYDARAFMIRQTWIETN